MGSGLAHSLPKLQHHPGIRHTIQQEGGKLTVLRNDTQFGSNLKRAEVRIQAEQDFSSCHPRVVIGKSKEQQVPG